MRLLKFSDGLFGGYIKGHLEVSLFLCTELCSSSLESRVLAAVLLQIQIFWDVTGSQDGAKITEDLKIWIFIPLHSTFVFNSSNIQGVSGGIVNIL